MSLASEGVARLPRSPADGRLSPWTFRLAYAAWLLGVFAFFIPASSWNPASRFALVRAIVEHGTFSINNYSPITGDRALVHGRWFSDKAPVPSLSAVPIYALVHWVQTARGEHVSYRANDAPATHLEPNRAFRQAMQACSLATAGLAGVAIALLLFELLRRRTDSRAAFAASSFAVLATPVLPYSTSFYGHVMAGAALLGAIVALDMHRGGLAGEAPSAWRVRIAGACLALAPGCEYIAAVPAALIGLWFLTHGRLPRLPRVLVNLGLGAVIPILVVAGYHMVVFGAPWRTGYSFVVQRDFAAGHSHGVLGIGLPRWEALLGLTMGTRCGLFFLSPVLLVGLWAAGRRAYRARDVAVGAGLAAFLCLLLLNAGYYMWWGGSAAGPRHLVPVVAMVAVGIAFALRGPRVWLSRMTMGLAGLSLAIQVAITLVGIEAPDSKNVLLEHVWPALRSARFAAFNGAGNWGVRLGLPEALSPLPLLGWLALGFFYLSRRAASLAEICPVPHVADDRGNKMRAVPRRRTPKSGRSLSHER